MYESNDPYKQTAYPYKGPTRFNELDADRRQAVSECVFTDTECQLNVRGWGLVVISEKGMSLKWGTDLPPNTVKLWGRAFR